MKKELLERLENETNAGLKYTKLADEKAKAGAKGSAINFLEIAKIAYICATKLHDEIWEKYEDELKEEDFEILSKAETVYPEIIRVYSEI